MGKELLDHALIQQMVEDLGDTAKELIMELVGALQNEMSKALRTLKASVESGDRQEVRDAAHRLKGSSANLGAAAVAEECDELEKIAFDATNKELALRIRRIAQLSKETLIAFRAYPFP